MLLNEFLKDHRKVEEQERQMSEHSPQGAGAGSDPSQS